MMIGTGSFVNIQKRTEKVSFYNITTFLDLFILRQKTSKHNTFASRTLAKFMMVDAW